MAGPIKYQGRVVRLGGENYTVPPLALGALRRLLPTINAIQAEASAGTMSEAAIDGVIDVAFAALSRNYPDLTREAVADLVDISTMNEVIEAVVSESGLVPKNG